MLRVLLYLIFVKMIMSVHGLLMLAGMKVISPGRFRLFRPFHHQLNRTFCGLKLQPFVMFVQFGPQCNVARGPSAKGSLQTCWSEFGADVELSTLFCARSNRIAIFVIWQIPWIATVCYGKCLCGSNGRNCPGWSPPCSCEAAPGASKRTGVGQGQIVCGIQSTPSITCRQRTQAHQWDGYGQPWPWLSSNLASLSWLEGWSTFVCCSRCKGLLQFCSWGEDIARMTYRWLHAIRWPDEDTGPLGYRPGTTWIELGLSWMCFHSSYLPVVRSDVHGEQRVIHLASFGQAKEYSFTWTEAGTVIEKIIGNVQALIPEAVFPLLKRQKVSSLYNLGAPKYHQGFNRRVQLPAQTQVFDWLQQVLSGTTDGKGLQGTPSLTPTAPCFGILPESWKSRCTKSFTAMAKARVQRKRMDNWPSFRCCVSL